MFVSRAGIRRLLQLVAALALMSCSRGAVPLTAATSSAGAIGNRAESRYAVLYRFGQLPDGNSPATDLVWLAGRLYGTTYGGGATSKFCETGCGTVYSIDPKSPSTSYERLYSFHGGSDGAIPNAGLNPNGSVPNTLFGTTFFGGQAGQNCYLGRRCGTVYSIDTSGNENVLHMFSGTDGANPLGGRHYDSLQKVFFGTTEYGGTNNFGTVYSVDDSGNEQLLYSFSGGPHDGAYPVGTLAVHCSLTACRLYGVTLQGGATNDGAIFIVTLDLQTQKISAKLLHSFVPAEGDVPLGGLELSINQLVVFGAASRDGANDRGSIFSYTTAPVAKFTILHSFNKGGDGELPYVRPTLINGALYGTTQEGGAYGSGTIYKIQLSKGYPQECILHSFPDPTVQGGDGLRPDSPLRNFKIGNQVLFFGTTVQGPKTNPYKKGFGTIYQIGLNAPCEHAYR